MVPFHGLVLQLWLIPLLCQVLYPEWQPRGEEDLTGALLALALEHDGLVLVVLEEGVDGLKTNFKS